MQGNNPFLSLLLAVGHMLHTTQEEVQDSNSKSSADHQMKNQEDVCSNVFLKRTTIMHIRRISLSIWRRNRNVFIQMPVKMYPQGISSKQGIMHAFPTLAKCFPWVWKNENTFHHLVWENENTLSIVRSGRTNENTLSIIWSGRTNPSGCLSKMKECFSRLKG